jgi:hypothetical protein
MRASPVARSGCPRSSAGRQHLTLADTTRGALEELAQDDVERNAFAGKLDGVRVVSDVGHEMLLMAQRWCGSRRGARRGACRLEHRELAARAATEQSPGRSSLGFRPTFSA